MDINRYKDMKMEKLSKKLLKKYAKVYGGDVIMSEKAIKKMLDLHSIGHVEKDGRIYAIAYYTTPNGRVIEEEEDVTGISRLNLLSWLGY